MEITDHIHCFRQTLPVVYETIVAQPREAPQTIARAIAGSSVRLYFSKTSSVDNYNPMENHSNSSWVRNKGKNPSFREYQNPQLDRVKLAQAKENASFVRTLSYGTGWYPQSETIDAMFLKLNPQISLLPNAIVVEYGRSWARKLLYTAFMVQYDIMQQCEKAQKEKVYDTLAVKQLTALETIPIMQKGKDNIFRLLCQGVQSMTGGLAILTAAQVSRNDIHNEAQIDIPAEDLLFQIADNPRLLSPLGKILVFGQLGRISGQGIDPFPWPPVVFSENKLILNPVWEQYSEASHNETEMIRETLGKPPIYGFSYTESDIAIVGNGCIGIHLMPGLLKRFITMFQTNQKNDWYGLLER